MMIAHIYWNATCWADDRAKWRRIDSVSFSTIEAAKEEVVRRAGVNGFHVSRYQIRVEDSA